MFEGGNEINVGEYERVPGAAAIASDGATAGIGVGASGAAVTSSAVFASASSSASSSGSVRVCCDPDGGGEERVSARIVT